MGGWVEVFVDELTVGTGFVVLGCVDGVHSVPREIRR